MSLPNELLPVGLLATPAAAAGAENRSLRFNPSDSAYLSRTPSSSGNRRTFTTSMWVKRCGIVNCGVVGQELFRAGNSALSAMNFAPSDGPCDSLSFKADQGGVSPGSATNAVFRDFSAWMHIVYRIDTTQSTADNRVRVYVNNVEQTWHTTNYPSQNQELKFNQSGQPHYIGGLEYLNGYLAQFAHVDGSSLAPTSFAEYDSNNAWVPLADLTGLSYGTNGFLLTFADNSSAAALGTDTSGNGNDWTVNNISVTAGAGNDSLADSPFNGDTANDTGLGNQVSGNYATLNPAFNEISRSSYPGGTITNGNLTLSGGSSSEAVGYSAIAIPQSGKWYFEVTAQTVGIDHYVQLASTATTLAYSEQNVTTLSHNIASNGDVLGYAIDRDANSYTVYKNGSSYSTGSVSAYDYLVRLYDYASFTHHINFGQRAFAYSAPSGFKALCTANLDDPLIADPSTVMDVKLWTGNGTSQTISGLGFSPDLVWIKNRNLGSDHEVYDRTRGAENVIKTSNTDAEGADANALLSFTSTGWTLGNSSAVNRNNDPIVAWTWDAGSSAVSNSNGSITSLVRRNTTAGFSIVTFTGNGTAGATVGHGLGVAPSFYVLKCRNNATNWPVYHAGLTNPEQKILILSSTTAEVDVTSYWNDTAPTSSVFSLGTDLNANGNTYTYVAYCFAPVESYSAFGRYTGNGNADGPFVYTGFRPKWIMTKRTDSIAFWMVLDSERDTYNVIDGQLYPNSASAESSSAVADFLSNGFKARSTSNEMNTSGGTYVYAAFAENPFKYARAR